MKKKYLICVCIMLVLSFLAVAAKEGSLSDSRVDYIYWDQPSYNMYWTGVTNKISYDYYAPCVGPSNSEYGCGERAYQSQYREYGFWTSASRHMHGLLNSWNSLEYRIE